VEGDLKPGQKIVVIEDLVSTGGSSLKAVKALRAAQADVLGMLAIFTYGFPVAEQQFATEKVELMTLSNYAAVLQHLLETNKIGEAELEVLKSWRENPNEWGK
jgi:orotate phosphoribosyltransferase